MKRNRHTEIVLHHCSRFSGTQKDVAFRIGSVYRVGDFLRSLLHNIRNISLSAWELPLWGFTSFSCKIDWLGCFVVHRILRIRSAHENTPKVFRCLLEGSYLEVFLLLDAFGFDCFVYGWAKSRVLTINGLIVTEIILLFIFTFIPLSVNARVF